MITIRPERPEDVPGIRLVNQRAFGGPDEAGMVDEARARGGWMISLVAVADDQLVGHILFTPVTISASEHVREAAGLAPMAVDPGHQGRGIGTRLASEGLARCRAAGYGIAVVLGHPTYYPRFGFVPGSLHGIRFALDVPDEAFMVIELLPGALEGCSGVARYLPEFMVL
ncbi:MAG: N-acetyltransferase [Acidobacteria bacterium]|nr:N-acetyltransferase [Acidobacteriota bacterium]MYJ06268.1 N-acetyltransferase [Acidobacteriota bacterium]